MMEGVDEEVVQSDKVGVVRLQTKENEYSLKTEDITQQELQEGVIPVEVEFHESTTGHVLGDILGGKDVNLSGGSIDGLDRPYMSPRSVGVTGMVEELTVRNYDNLNMAVVGPSRSSERMPPRLSQRQQLHHTAGRSALDRLHGGVANNEENLGRSNLWEDRAGASASEISPQKPYRDERNEAAPPLSGSENKEMTGKALACGAFRTKILTKSGFSEFFIKNTLKGKGIICRGPPVDNQHIESRNQQTVKVGGGFKIAADTRPISAANTAIPAASNITEARASRPANDGISLRTWLNNGNTVGNKVERLNIFRQIVDLVDCYHSQGVAMPELRPSSFMLRPSNQVKYVGPLEHIKMLESCYDRDMSDSNAMLVTKRSSDYGLRYPLNTTKKQKLNEDVKHSQWVHFHSRTRSNAGNLSVGGMNISELRSNNEHGELKKENDSQKSNNWYKSNDQQRHSAITCSQSEDKWYQSPEDQTNGGGSISSNIYCLGVLLFELLGHFDSESTRDAAMMDLRHRILPPHFLLENPKEAGFCLLLLYPDPASRPSSRKILESEVLSGLNDGYSEEMISSIEQDDAESELLLHFLTSLKEQKQKEASKLVDNINCIETDIAEIGRRHSTAKPYLGTGSSSKNFTSLDVNRLPSPVSDAEDSRWLGNIKLLETAYFSMRSRLQLPEIDASRRTDNDLLRNRENWQQAQLRDEEPQITTDRVGAFFDGLCKYARHNKFEVRGVLRNGEFNNSVNVICSLSFSRDEDYFAAAGVSKKIKIFEFHGLLNEAVDIHYPAIEMTNGSKLSCVCWNNYIRNYLASTDYDGIVKLWDASTGQGFSEYREHKKRAWSIDFSPVCPTKFASGSDDCSVKLWSISEKNCLGTVRNIANICCVQFSPHSTHLLAFGSADYKTYCYDLRNVRSPWCVLSGHHKAVSYVKFLDAGTIATASTDNSLKLWDLNKTNPGGLSANACSLTLTGHTNEKNFVGLSAADGYISCGSETNEVFAYHKSLPMPITSHKFGSIDPISGKETDDDNGQFVSSVCWKGKTDTLIAANSSGCIKVLQMV